jgi:hypothetical protein
MKRNKFLAITPLVVLIVMMACSCGSGTAGGSTSVGTGSPTPPPTFDTMQGFLCLGNAALNFGNLSERDDGNLFLKILADIFQSISDESCLKTITTGLVQLEANVNQGEYVDVGPATPEFKTVTVAPPQDVFANCTASPTKYSWVLGPPWWISVRDIDKQQDVVYQWDPFLTFAKPTYTRIVGDYLWNTYKLIDLPSRNTYYNSATILQPDQYAEYVVTPFTITYETGIYAVYQGQKLIKGPAQWSFIENITFPANIKGTAINGARAKGLCATA